MKGALAILILLFAGCSHHKAAQLTQTAVLKKTLPNFVAGNGIESAVENLCRGAKLICGLQMSARGPEEDHGNVEIDHSISVDDALAWIKNQYPDYRWEVHDGVLDFLPNEPKLVPQIHGRDPMRLLIGSYDAKNESSRLVVSQLCSLVGISQGGGINDGLVREFGMAAGISVRLRNAPLLDALNQVADADGEAVWKVEYSRTWRPEFNCLLVTRRSPFH